MLNRPEHALNIERLVTADGTLVPDDDQKCLRGPRKPKCGRAWTLSGAHPEVAADLLGLGGLRPSVQVQQAAGQLGSLAADGLMGTLDPPP